MRHDFCPTGDVSTPDQGSHGPRRAGLVCWLPWRSQVLFVFLMNTITFKAVNILPGQLMVPETQYLHWALSLSCSRLFARAKFPGTIKQLNSGAESNPDFTGVQRPQSGISGRDASASNLACLVGAVWSLLSQLVLDITSVHGLANCSRKHQCDPMIKATTRESLPVRAQ